MAAQSCGRSKSDHVHLCCTKYLLVCKSLRRVKAPRQSLEALDCPWRAPTFTFPGYGSLAVTEVSLMGKVTTWHVFDSSLALQTTTFLLNILLVATVATALLIIIYARLPSAENCEMELSGSSILVDFSLLVFMATIQNSDHILLLLTLQR